MQRALETCSEAEAFSLANELRGRARYAAMSPQAHSVLLKMLTLLPLVRVTFVVRELTEAILDLARHRYASQVLRQLVQQASAAARRLELEAGGDAITSGIMPPDAVLLMNALLEHTAVLSRDAMGHRIVEMILERSSDTHRAQVVAALSGNLMRHSKSRFSSHIVEKALEVCDAETLESMVQELVTPQENLLILATNRFGRFVAKELISLAGGHGVKVRQIFVESVEELRKSKYGSRFLSELEREHPHWQHEPEELHVDRRRLSWADEASDAGNESDAG
jgi:hypothetical protein